MEMISRPLAMSLLENRAQLAASEKQRGREGDPSGNRHQRRLAAKRERQAKKREPSEAR